MRISSKAHDALGASVRQMCRFAVALTVTITIGCFAGPPAFAVVPAAHLALHTLALPTHFSSSLRENERCENTNTPDGTEEAHPPFVACDGYQVTVTNTGSLVAAGPVVLSDTLPAKLHVVRVNFFWNQVTVNRIPGEYSPGVLLESEELCKTVASTVTCEFTPEVGELKTGQRLEMQIDATVEAGAASGEVNTANVSEAGTSVASSSEGDVVSESAPAFGVSGLFSETPGVDGTPDTQAGDHPYDLRTRFDLNTKMMFGPETSEVAPVSVQQLKDVVVDLPPGLIGSAVAAPKCTFGQLQTEVFVSFKVTRPACPLDSLVGHISTEPANAQAQTSANTGIYNMVPEKGVVAEFGFRDGIFNTHTIVAGVAPTPSGYVVRATAREIPQLALQDAITDFYGDPAERNEGGGAPAAMFTNPSDCSGSPLVTTIYADSWENPAAFNADGTPVNLEESAWVKAESESPPVTGCSALRFTPEAFSVQPDTSAADSPSGLTFDLQVAQTEQPNTHGTPPLRDSTVTLPAGLIANPASAAGLVGCSEEQIGWLGGTLTNFTPAPPACPDASRLGSVEVTTPILEKPIVGSLYLANQNENPFNTILGGYIVIDDPTTGIIVKIPGKLTSDPTTGQITGVFDKTPQTPFSDLKLRFFGGTPSEPRDA